MTAFEPARPRYVLPFAGKDYELFGTMEVIEAIEFSMKESVLDVCFRVIDMGVTDTARVIAAILSASGHKDHSPRSVSQALMDMGVAGQAFTVLRAHISCFLQIILQPPELREETAKRMGEVMGKFDARTASPGENTSSSA
ncbi:hypothetical protein [Tautonia marina]|uniref:hypothetical protein n=1 Tax=Tautonia marina TaxID=2653855 RepID=UPI001260AEBA|nr:hypothetical protein [Tautonia marina]